MPAQFAERAPRVSSSTRTAMEYWLYDGERHYQRRAQRRRRPAHRGASASSPAVSTRCAAARGTSTPASHDMDLNGVYASLNFPSSLAGVRRPALPARRERPRAGAGRGAGLRTTGTSRSGRGTIPDRIIPCQLPWLLDPEVAAAEVRRNADARLQGHHVHRGAREARPAVAAHRLLGPAHGGVRGDRARSSACTSARRRAHRSTSSDAPADTIGVLFFGYAMFAAVDWLYSKIPVRFPSSRSACPRAASAGWPGLLDRLDHVGRYQQIYGTWEGIELTPAEVLQRNFWFCAIDDPSALEQRHRIGDRPPPARVRLPPPGRHLARHPAAAARADRLSFPADDIRKITWENALEAVPAPGARRRAGRPRRVLT